MSIYIASDHRGLELQDYLISNLSSYYNIVRSNVENSEEDDYPDFAFDICSKMSKEEDIGIVICGNGVGISIASNKVKGIRCARVDTIEDAIAAKEHNRANVIALPATLDKDYAVDLALAFIKAKPSDLDRHVRRVNKIIAYENGEYNEL